MGPVEKNCWKKMKHLEGKFKNLENSALTKHSTNRPPENYSFSVNSSQALHARTDHAKWIVKYGYNHYMAKNASLFSTLSGAPKEKIYVVDYYSLTVSRNGDVECQHGHISDIYHVSILSANLLSDSQLTKPNNNVEFWLD